MFSMERITYTFNLLAKKTGSLLHFLYPALCLVCGLESQQNRYLCNTCRAVLPFLGTHVCLRCAIPLTVSHQVCGKCLLSPPPFDRAQALFHYQGAILHMIKALKFQGKLFYATLFAHLLSEKIQALRFHYPKPDLLIPVPLHRQRLRERGFNQTLVIARTISRTLKIPLDYVSLRRHQPTSTQSELLANDREKNVRHAFESCRDYNNLCVAVLDDVMTTSFTMRACCNVIKLNGAKEVHAWVLARR